MDRASRTVDEGANDFAGRYGAPIPGGFENIAGGWIAKKTLLDSLS